ncbi:hypothetical protein Xcc3_18120 [Xanthomonas campestris pv. campestris]|nr:hypothetical protein Xcc3_18120 [Xanthomonas campestris pv. campestris]
MSTLCGGGRGAPGHEGIPGKARRARVRSYGVAARFGGLSDLGLSKPPYRGRSALGRERRYRACPRARGRSYGITVS